MHRKPGIPLELLELQLQPVVACYSRQEAAKLAFTMQIGSEWATVKWDAADPADEVAKQLRDVVTWLEARSG